MSVLNFLICSERSGSNLIRSMLNAHPLVYAPQPLHLGRDFFGRLHRFGDLREDENWSFLIAEVIERFRDGVGELNFDITEKELLDNVPKGSFANIYSYIYHKGMRLEGKQSIFIKENHTHRYTHPLLEAFPDSRFVYQVRDPRDFLVSCKKTNWSRTRSSYGTKYRTIELWRDDQEQSLSFYYRYPEKVFIQRYEDLLTNPSNVLQHLCSFLELPFDESVLRFNETKDALAAVKRHPATWKNLANPLMSENKEKWKTELGSIELRAVEYSLTGLMSVFGYRSQSGDYKAGVITTLIIEAYKWTGEASLWLKKPWFFCYFWRKNLVKIRRTGTKKRKSSPHRVVFPYEA